MSVERSRSSTVSYDLLLHVVSHADLLATLVVQHPSLDESIQVLARPHFSFFKPLCAGIIAFLDDPPASTSLSDALFNVPGNGRQSAGIVFDPPLQGLGNFADWRMRSRDWKKVKALENILETDALISVLYFPVISALIYMWSSRELNFPLGGPSKQFLYLISGSGVPADLIDSNPDPTGNSTFELSLLMNRLYLSRLYPNVHVTLIDSGPGLFSHSENVRFMGSKVRPLISMKRKELANMYNTEWKHRLRVNLTLLSGPAARIQALHAVMRPFKPNYLYLSETKRLWHRYPHLDTLWLDDVEVLLFQDAELSPATILSELVPDDLRLVNAMIEHKQRFQHALTDSSNELTSFWLRKTRQPVLSVLMIESPRGSEQEFFPGINMEVSMPTGSLCAERNAIGNALASFPLLKRNDMKAIAVLSLSSLLSPDASNEGVSKNPINPCGACSEWLKKIAASNPDFHVLTFTDNNCSKVYINSVV